MTANTALRRISDRTLDRAIRLLAVAVPLGAILIGAFYWFDRNPAAPPSPQMRAVASAEAAVRNNPNDLDARINLAAALVVAGRVEGGIEQYNQVLTTAPTNRDALLGRGLAYLRIDDQGRARADFQAFVDQNAKLEMAGSDSQLAQAYFQLGTIALDEDRSHDAAAAFEAALRIDRSDADALYGLGRALIADGNPERGVAALRLAVAYVPMGWCEPYTSLVDGYRVLADADGVAYASAMVSFCTGDIDAARSGLTAIVSGKHAVDALIGLGYVSAERGDRSAAADYFGQALAIEPTNQSASIGLQTLGRMNESPSP